MLAALALLTAPLSIQAMNIAPFKPGQKVNSEQAQQLQQRYKERKQQAWKEPNSGDIDKQADAG